ncbi:MAG: CPBP family intramembrane metalloprotease [Bacteroidetes bacterium]|nr:CPBP family intramembrane metalloprotease [Bacteroidota bacterium]
MEDTTDRQQPHIPEPQELNDFWYAHGEMRAVWKLGIYGVTAFFLMFVVGMVVYLALPQLDWRFSTPLMTLGAALAASTLCALALDRRPLLEMLALPWQRFAWKQLGLGMLLTFGMMLALVGLELVFGEARMISAHVTFGHSLSIILLGLLSFTLVAFAEEILVRGYPFSVLLRQVGTVPALLLTSGVFSLMHLFNPGIGWLPLLNIFLAGIWLGIARIVSGSLWLPIGLHIGWNFYLGPVFGFPVSGIIERSLFVTRPEGPAWISGGIFGPEGGVLATLVLIAGTALLYLPWFREALSLKEKGEANGKQVSAGDNGPGHMTSSKENENEVL